MTATPQVRGSAYLLFIELLEKAGAERELEKALLPSILYRNPEALVPIHLAHRFIEEGARALGLLDFGFVAARHARVDHLGAFGRTLRRSLTLHDALGRIRSTFALYSSSERVWWHRRHGRVYFYHAFTADSGAGQRYAQQGTLLLIRDLVRLAAGPDWQPDEVLWTDRSADGATIYQLFEGARTTPSQHIGLVFPAELLRRSLTPAPTDLSGSDDADIAALQSYAPAEDFVGSIKQIVATMMGHGRIQLNEIADAIGMHARTLQRRLSDHGEEYSNVLAQVRFEAALELMRDPNQRLVEIAYELGYSDPSNFTRAFRGWTGTNPSNYRRMEFDI